MERLWTKEYILLTVGMLFLFTSFYFLLPTLPQYVQQLGGGEFHVGLVAGVFTLSAVIFRPIAGVWLDRYGRRPFALWGLVGFVLSMILYDWVSGLAALVALRIFHGACWAFSTTAVSTQVTDVIPPARRGEGMGWYGMAMTLSMAIGPMAGTRILEKYSFHPLFLWAAVLSLVALALVFAVRIPFQRKDGTKRIELVEKALWPVTATVLLMTVSYGGITAFVPLFAQSVHVDPGFFFLVYAIALTLIRPVAGRLADRFGEGNVIVPALAVIVLALLVLSQTRGFAGVLVSAVLYGIGFGSAHPALQATALRLASPDRKGGANASFSSAFDLGIGLGSILLGWVSQFLGYPALFASCAASVAFSLLIFAVFVRRQLAASAGKPEQAGM